MFVDSDGEHERGEEWRGDLHILAMTEYMGLVRKEVSVRPKVAHGGGVERGGGVVHHLPESVHDDVNEESDTDMFCDSDGEDKWEMLSVKTSSAPLWPTVQCAAVWRASSPPCPCLSCT